MKKKVIVYMLLFAMTCSVFAGCDNAVPGDGTQNTEQGTSETENQTENGKEEDKDSQIDYVDKNGYLQDDSVFVVGVEKLPCSHEQIYQQLFDLKNFIQIKVDITEEQLMQIQKDYDKYAGMGSKSPIYREASMNIRIKARTTDYTYHIPNIGIRMKGNTSRTSFYNDHEGQYNLIHFRIKFMDDDFATLENLEVKWNRNDDETYIREIYAYEMYRDMGILAPRTTLASFDLADVHQGVFTVYEPVDKNFIERYLPEEDQGGDLYKCGWTMRGASLRKKCTYGIEDEDKCEFYNYDLKTNKKTSNHAQMKNLLNVLDSGRVTKEQIAEVVDMENFLRFAAVSYFVGNPDDSRYNYNNHYIYFLKSSGKAIFIPYDCDRVFGVTKTWNPTGNGMTDVDPFTTKAEGANEDQKNPLYRNTTDRGGYYNAEFAKQLEYVSTSKWLQPDYFETYYNIASRNYALYTTPGKTFYNAEHHFFGFDINKSAGLNTDHGNATFEEYVTAKLASFHKYMNKYYNE